jgi:predicted nucleic acid-binding protein
MIVADSDVLIDALRGREPAKGRIAEELGKGTLATTSVSVFELLSGAKTAAAKKNVRRLLDAVLILPLDERASETAAEVRKNLEAKGSTIGMADYLIAGICLSRTAILLTRNKGHFERIAGLALGAL